MEEEPNPPELVLVTKECCFFCYKQDGTSGPGNGPQHRERRLSLRDLFQHLGVNVGQTLGALFIQIFPGLNSSNQLQILHGQSANCTMCSSCFQKLVEFTSLLEQEKLLQIKKRDIVNFFGNSIQNADGDKQASANYENLVCGDDRTVMDYLKVKRLRESFVKKWKEMEEGRNGGPNLPEPISNKTEAEQTRRSVSSSVNSSEGVSNVSVVGASPREPRAAVKTELAASTSDFGGAVVASTSRASLQDSHEGTEVELREGELVQCNFCPGRFLTVAKLKEHYSTAHLINSVDVGTPAPSTEPILRTVTGALKQSDERVYQEGQLEVDGGADSELKVEKETVSGRSSKRVSDLKNPRTKSKQMKQGIAEKIPKPVLSHRINTRRSQRHAQAKGTSVPSRKLPHGCRYCIKLLFNRGSLVIHERYCKMKRRNVAQRLKKKFAAAADNPSG